MRCLAVATAVLEVLVISQPLDAQLIYSNQSRSVSAEAMACDAYSYVAISAPDFGVFDAFLESEAAIGGMYGFVPQGAATASQTSSLSASDIHATGFATGYVGGCVGTGGAEGTSFFYVGFDVVSTISFGLTGVVQPNPGYSQFTLEFVGPSGPIFTAEEAWYNSPPPLDPVVFDITGILVSGSYWLRSDTSSHGTFFEEDSGRLQYDFSLTVVPTCDFSGDGFCDVSDLDLMFLQGPIAAGVSATGREEFDLNGDGTIDLQDRDQWLAEAAALNGFASPYKLGDANLSGTVDGGDFATWNSFKFTENLHWSRGNFDGDPWVDGSDFIAWSTTKFTSSDGMSAVPEPGIELLVILFLAILGAARNPA